jgi:hypothetical protein
MLTVVAATLALGVARPAAAQPADSNDNFASVVYNHFGNPSAGQAVVDTWLHITYNQDFMPATARLDMRATTLYRVARIAFRGELYSDAHGLVASTATFNTSGARLLARSSTSVSLATNVDPPNCVLFQIVYYAIRWTDGTLTSGKTLISASDYWNDNCYFLGATATREQLQEKAGLIAQARR